MFDDPKKELKRLEDQLLAAEEEQWGPPQEEPESEEDFLDEEPWDGQLEPEEEETLPAKQNSHVPALVAALLLEVAALFVVLAWWLLCR